MTGRNALKGGNIMKKNNNTVDIINTTDVSEQAFLALFGETEEGKALAEKQAKEEAERLQRAKARMEHIEHNVDFVQKMFDIQLPGLAQLIEKICWDSGAPRRVGKFFLVYNKDFSLQREIDREPITLTDEKYLVKLGDFDKTVGAPKVIVADATEGGPIDQALQKQKADKVAAAKAKADAYRAAQLAAAKREKGEGRVKKLESYLSRISQEPTISPETTKFLMSDLLPNCSPEFKASREEVLSYKNDLDAKSYPDQIPEEGPFAVLAPVRRMGELRETLFVFVPEVDAKKAFAFQLQKFLSEELVSKLMENLPGDARSWYANVWRRQGKESFMAYSEGIAKALRLEPGQIAFDLLQGIVKVVQPAGKGGNIFIMANPNEASCFIVKKPDGKMIPNLYLP